jgi:hypothetical protein
LQHSFPELFSFCRDTLVKAVKSAATAINLFHLPLSTEAYEQFQQLDIITQNIQLNSDSDQWRYIWGFNIFSHQAKLTKFSLEAPKCTLFTNGFGNLHAKIRESFYFGFSSRIG